MRKLAPAFLMTSMIAFAGGALANTTADKTDKVTGSPTVSTNQATGQDLSYSDKSNTSSGTNAKLDTKNKKKKAKGNMATDGTMKSDTSASTDTTGSTSITPSTASPSSTPSAATGGTTASRTNSTTGQSPQ
jgi:hypothetical protein